jgi:L-ascorbate metabolism protein UlaG (beta-lactamase superfamily)
MSDAAFHLASIGEVCFSKAAMKFTYFGHSCFLVECSGARLLFDPFITPNPLASKIDVKSIEADVILISHGHVDHIADAVAMAKQTGATVVANWEIAEWLGKQGAGNTVAMNHGGWVKLPCGRAKMVNAIHSSGLPDGTYGGNPAGFVIDTAEGAFYYAGDTALTLDMKLIAEQFKLRFAILPIGDTFTMGASDAAQAARFCGAPITIGVHYNTFPPIEIKPEAAQEEFQKNHLRLLLPAIGETLNL